MQTEEIAKMAVSLSLEAQGFEKKMSSINKSIKNAERDFKSAGKGVEGFEKSFTGLDAKIKKTEKQLDLYNKKLVEQKEQYKKVQSDLVATKNKLDELEKTQGRNSDAWKEQAQLVQKNAQDLVKLNTDINATEADIKKLTNELNNAQKEFNELGNKTKTLDEKLEDISREANLTQSEFDKLGNELNENGTYFQKLGNEMNKLSAEITAGVNKIDAYENEIDKLSDTLNKQKAEYSQLESKIQTYSQHLDRASSMYGENSSQANEYRQKLLQLKDSYNNLENEITQGSNALDKYQTELNQTQVEVNNLSNDLKNMPFEQIGDDLKSSGESLKSVGQNMTTGVTLPLVAAGAAATKVGTDFSTSMSKLQATSGIADKTSESYKRLEQKAKEMGSSTSFSASEAADGLTYLALAGWDVETQIARIEPVLRAAEAGGMDLAQCADLVTDSMSSASIASEDFSRYLDITAQAQRKSNTSMQQMLEAYVLAGGMFNQMNMELEESGALLGVLANRGKKGSEAANGLISVFANLITETGQAGTALDKLNISLYDSNGKQRNMIDVLKEMANKLGVASDGTSNLTEKQKQQYAAMVGGKTQFDTLMAALAGVSGEYDQLYNDLVNSNGALNEMATIMKDNLGGELDNMKSAIEGALIEAFVALEPVLEKVVEMITNAANWFSNLDDEQQKNIVTTAGIIAALGPLLSVVGQILIVGGNTVTLLGALKNGSSENIKMFGLLKNAIKLVSGPAGMVALVGMLIALISKLGENEDKLTELQEKWGVLGEVIGSVCEHISGTVQLTFGNIWILVSTLCKTIMAIISGDFKSIDDIWSECWAKIENNTAKAASNINQESSRGIALLREMTERELNNLTNTLEIALQKLPELTADNASEMANIFVTRMQGLDQDTLTILRGTSDTMAVLFEGINANMSNDEAHKKFTANLESMAKSGEFTADQISKDISDAMNLIDKNVMDGSERVKNSAQDMFDGIASISQFGMDSAVSNIVSSVNNMSDETIQSLSAMGGHWEALFGGIALTGKDAVADMDSHIRGRLQELASSSPEFIAEMEAQMSQHFSNINQEGTSNANELSTNVENALSKTEQSLNTHTKNAANNVEVNTKSAADSAKTNMNNAATEVGKAASNMAKEAKKGTSQVAQNTDTDMKQANKSVQQSATDMYNGASKSYSKLKDNAKRDMTDMYKGTKTSAENAASSAKSAASDMYRGVTTSTNKMANEAIADWNRIRNAYSRSIKGSVTMTKTTVNKVEKRSLNDSIANYSIDNPSIPQVFDLKMPDISRYKIRGGVYTPSTIQNSDLINNNRDNETIKNLNTVIKLLKNQLTKTKSGDVIVKIENFNNNTDRDMDSLIDEIIFRIRRESVFE